MSVRKIEFKLYSITNNLDKCVYENRYLDFTNEDKKYFLISEFKAFNLHCWKSFVAEA